jgi:hypothetical protein
VCEFYHRRAGRGLRGPSRRRLRFASDRSPTISGAAAEGYSRVTCFPMRSGCLGRRSGKERCWCFNKHRAKRDGGLGHPGLKPKAPPPSPASSTGLPAKGARAEHWKASHMPHRLSCPRPGAWRCFVPSIGLVSKRPGKGSQRVSRCLFGFAKI